MIIKQSSTAIEFRLNGRKVRLNLVLTEDSVDLKVNDYSVVGLQYDGTLIRYGGLALASEGNGIHSPTGLQLDHDWVRISE